MNGAPPEAGPVSPENISVRGLNARSRDLDDCHVELHADGTVFLVVNGERLFRFDSIDALLEQYQLQRGNSKATVSGELAAAQAAAGIAIAAISSRPRAEKALAEGPVTEAIERIREARARLDAYDDRFIAPAIL